MSGGTVNHVKITVKLVALITILVAAAISHRRASRSAEVTANLAHTVDGLTLASITLAVFW